MGRDITEKMRPAFRALEGGLFTDVAKADVGGAYLELERQGVTMLSWADPFNPDRCLPPHVYAALVRAAEDALAPHYTTPIGSPQLREKIAGAWRESRGFPIDPRRNILVTPGSDSGLLYAMMPFVGPGDQVMVPDPSYPSNFLNPRLLGGETVHVPLDAGAGYRLDVDAFRSRLTERTKLVLLTSPNNPTGTVFSRQSLTELAAWIVENDLVCVCDEAFADTVFTPGGFVSIAGLEGMWRRTLTVCSFSKGLGLSGLRVGYIVADELVMDKLYGGAVNVLGATGTAQQLALLSILEDTGFAEQFMEKYDRRRRYACDAFNAVPGVRMALPQATFLCWADVGGIGDSTDIMNWLVRRARVSVNDGKAYGRQGSGHLRIVTGCYWDDGVVCRAIDRMYDALRQYPAAP